jgi:hypothetical protein
MPRFATQMEAEAAHQAAMEGLSTEHMTWEEYAATHPHESMGAPPMPRSQAFPERREGQLKSANDCLSPAPPHLRLHLTRLLGTFDLALVHAQSLQTSKIWNPSQRGAAPVTCLILTPTTMYPHGLSWTRTMRMMMPQMRTRRQAVQ